MAKVMRTHEIQNEALSGAENRARKERARSRAKHELALRHRDEYRSLLADFEAAEGVVNLPRGPRPAWMDAPRGAS